MRDLPAKRDRVFKLISYVTDPSGERNHCNLVWLRDVICTRASSASPFCLNPCVVCTCFLFLFLFYFLFIS